ncbi:MAG: glycerophosphodiester phosphodiesterase [Eubacteriales bacterium]
MIDNSFIGKNVYVQAHRGYSGLYPENTMISFEKAIEAGADIIELDVHISKDKEVFVIHDETFDRTTDGSGYIGEKTRSQIKKLDAGSWFSDRFKGEKVPTLVESLDLIKGNALTNIEIKAFLYKGWRETLQETVKIINDLNLWNEVLFISFDLQALMALKEYKRGAYAGFLDIRKGQELMKIDLLKFLDINGWYPHPIIASKPLVEQAKNKGMSVICGAGKSEENIEEEVINKIEMGVNGLSTNHPRKVRKILEEL